MSQANHQFIYLSTTLTVVCLHLASAYRSTVLMSLHIQLSTLFIGGAGALFVVLGYGFLSPNLDIHSRLWIMSTTLIATALLLTNRVAMAIHLRRAIQAKKFMESILIVGANEHAEKMIAAILNTPYAGINILGIFDDRTERPLPPTLSPRILGSTEQLLSYIRCNRVDRVVVALPWVASDRINALLKKLRTVPVRIDLVPNDLVWQFQTINMERLGNVPVLTVANGRVDIQGGLVKRIEDLAIASILVVLTTPLLLLIALLIRLDSNGPALFKQRRHGYN
ncbi:MAG: hypothetical protein EOO61_16355, partial [Hymenobacter sp.]